MKNKNVEATREQILAAVARAKKREAYNKVRNQRSDVKAKRRAYNKDRREREKELLALAKKQGLLRTGSDR